MCQYPSIIDNYYDSYNLFDKIICTETGIRNSKNSDDLLQFFDISKRKSIKGSIYGDIQRKSEN